MQHVLHLASSAVCSSQIKLRAPSHCSVSPDSIWKPNMYNYPGKLIGLPTFEEMEGILSMYANIREWKITNQLEVGTQEATKAMRKYRTNLSSRRSWWWIADLHFTPNCAERMWIFREGEKENSPRNKIEKKIQSGRERELTKCVERVWIFREGEKKNSQNVLNACEYLEIYREKTQGGWI